MKKTIVIVLILSLIGKGLGFLRDILITNTVGFNFETDALFLALSLTTIIFSIFSTSIRTTFAPIFSENIIENPSVAINDYRNLKRFILFIAFITSVIVFVFSEWILKVFALGLDTETFNLSNKFLKTLSVLVFLYAYFSITIGFLQAARIYRTAETAIIINNFVIVLFILLFYEKLGIWSILLGFILGAVTQVILANYILLKKVPKPIEHTAHKANKEKILKFLNMSKYVLFGSVVAQLTLIADKSVASFLEEGSITALHYSSLLRNLPLNIIILVVTNVLFTNLSLYYKKDKSMFYGLIEKQLNYLSFMISPFIVFFLLYSEDLVDMLYNRGSFTENGVDMISSALVAYSAGMLFWVIKEVFNKVCYAAGNTKLPLITALVSLLINVALNVFLGIFMGLGHVGIALATSISILINASLTLIYLIKKNIIATHRNTIIISCKALVNLLIILSIAYIYKEYGYEYNSQTVEIILGFIIISLITLIMSRFMGINLKIYKRGKK
ncbi:murein biosynthesis integral membrane protein MurJ [Bhargavaea ginsengi]|uniref:Murein biosynthesis integral membrane protein MurJ n=1 Tax=Bhargavaea ginsengi TaxID=426757 RepID=A0A1H6UW37_9BACL|nr:lipid II flippase MurJ [Bhargavaea ginsengi]SEI92550.1 murein biosynthesis integral membrane protein MurJ [Bhargavaea ginsengi]